MLAIYERDLIPLANLLKVWWSKDCLVSFRSERKRWNVAKNFSQKGWNSNLRTAATASNSIYSPQASNSKGLMMFHGPKYVLWKCVFRIVCVFMFDGRRTVFSASCRSILISFASSLISRVWSSLASFSDDVEATSTQPLLLSRLTLQKWLRPPPYSLNWPKGTIGAKVIKENYNFGLSPTRSSTMSLKTFLCTLKVI